MRIETIGQKLRGLRIALDMSQGALANALGVSEKSIQRYETNKNLPDIYTLAKMSAYFDVSSDYLLGLAGIEQELKETKNKILKGNTRNELYKHYLACKNNISIDDNSTYFWIYYRDNGDCGGQTSWVGWTDDSRKTEIRRLCPVDPLKAIEACIEYSGSRPMLVNEVLDVRVFSIFGGEALIKEEVCRKYIPALTGDLFKDTEELYNLMQ